MPSRARRPSPPRHASPLDAPAASDPRPLARRRALGRLLGRLIAGAAALLPLALAPGCAEERGAEVVVYCALDVEFSDAILQDFTKATGVPVRLVADNEITKTVGLANQIKLEKEHPKADVFWNNEIVNTIRLKDYGCLEPYVSPSAADIPASFKDRDGYWTGFAARARVFIVHESCPADRTPDSWLDYLDPAQKGKLAIAKPVAGTTATHLAVLFEKLGEAKAKEWWVGLHQNQTALLTGNAHVMRSVRAGEFAAGFTDTDDYRVAELDGYPVRCVYPDQGEGELGCLLIPNTISLVKGGPNPALARQFIDYVLSRETEAKLAASASAQIPVRADVPAPPHVRRIGAFKVMEVDFEKAASHFDAAQAWLTTPGVPGK